MFFALIKMYVNNSNNKTRNISEYFDIYILTVA